MADATPFVRLPAGAEPGVPPEVPAPTRIGPRVFRWGQRTFVMGILNVTPDSFSGDGLLAPDVIGRVAGRSGPAGGARGPLGGEGGPDEPLNRSVVGAAVALARRMVDDGADLLDVGGESTRPGHTPVAEAEELRRVVPVVRALREAFPDVPLSIDTVKPAVAEAALAAGADLLNDVWGVDPSDDLVRLAASSRVPLIVMHNRSEPRYRNVVGEVLADLQRALDRALSLGVGWDDLIVDPGMGFGKTAEQNLALLHDLTALRDLRRPILLGMSRKSTIGRVLDLPAGERLEGTLATTALGIAAGVDIVRVHDVRANSRVARMSDAIVRRPPPETTKMNAHASGIAERAGG